MVGANVAAVHVVGRDARVVLADVRERRDAGDVAERPDVLGRAHPLVDLDPAPADRQAERLEPVDVRPASGGDEQPVERDLAAVARVSTRRPSTACACDAESDLDAVLPQRVVDERRGVGVDAGEQPLAALDERHLRADALEELRELAPDRARRRARRGAPAPRSSRSPRCSSSSRPRRARRSAGSPATSRSRSRAGRTAAPGRRLDDARLGHHRVAAHQLGVSGREPFDLRGVVPLGDDVAPGEDLLRVERGRADRAECARAPRRRAPARAASSSSACRPSTSTRRRRAAARRASPRRRRSSRRRAPTKCSPVDPPPRTTTCDKALREPVRLQERLRDLRRRLLVDVDRLVHRDDRGQRQLRRDRVHRRRELRARAVATDVLTIGATFWKPVTCFGSAQHRVLRGLARAAGRSRTRRPRAPCPRRAPRRPRCRRAGRT